MTARTPGAQVGRPKNKAKGPRPKHIPQRMCISCRERSAKRTLFRIVRTPEGSVEIDATGKMNGRGAYLCDDPACWRRALSSNALARALKIELPDASARFLIFNTVQWVLNEEMTQDGLPLVELSHRVASRLAASSVQQNTVYRLLNGLYRAGAFEFTANPDNDYDPRILYARVPLLNFDHAFVLNLLRALRKKHPSLGTPDRLAAAIYGTPAQTQRVVQLLALAADPHVGRGNIADALSKIGGPSG